MKHNKTIFILLLIVALAASSWTAWRMTVDLLAARERRLLLAKKAAAWKALGSAVEKQIAGFNGEAGLVIKDLRNGWQIVHNPDKLFPSASLAKIPIMAGCFQATASGKLDLRQKIRLKDGDKVSGSGVLKHFSRGRQFSVEQLIWLMITRSDNTATNMLIELLGIDQLNVYFHELGMERTNLARKMMDFRRRRQGVENFTTAREISSILEKFYRRQFISREASRKCLVMLNHQKVADRIPAKLPADTMVAHKTGLEKGVCHDAGIVFTEKGDFLICVLTSHGNRTARPAKKFIAEVALLAYNYYRDEL